MARTDNLPIYKKTFDLLLEMHKLYAGFDKKYKYGLGSDCVNTIKKALLLIVRINSVKNKLNFLEELLFVFHEIQINIRLLKSLNVLKNNTYFSLSENIIGL